MALALLGTDHSHLRCRANVSLPTSQRREASDGQVRSVVDTLVKVINALETAGIEIIGENATSNGAGRGGRLKDTAAGSQPKRVPSMLYDQAGEPQAENEAI